MTSRKYLPLFYFKKSSSLKNERHHGKNTANRISAKHLRHYQCGIRFHRSVIIRDKEKSLVKISPIAHSEQGSWLGCMKGKGKIKGDIVAPAEDAQNWQVLSE